MKKDVCSKDDGGFVARIIGGEVEMHRLVHFDKFFSNFFCLESHFDINMFSAKSTTLKGARFETSAKELKVALIFIERFK
jgi:hypothetical protein